jgi:hypothetical protein
MTAVDKRRAIAKEFLKHPKRGCNIVRCEECPLEYLDCMHFLVSGPVPPIGGFTENLLAELRQFLSNTEPEAKP